MPKLSSLKSEKRLLDRQAADRIRSHILEGAERDSVVAIVRQTMEASQRRGA